jgi:cell division protein ZapD
MVGEGTAGLLRITLQPGVNLYPEISGSHHRFTVRFMQWPDASQRPVQINKDVHFRLTIC